MGNTISFSDCIFETGCKDELNFNPLDETNFWIKEINWDEMSINPNFRVHYEESYQYDVIL